MSHVDDLQAVSVDEALVDVTSAIARVRRAKELELKYLVTDLWTVDTTLQKNSQTLRRGLRMLPDVKSALALHITYCLLA